MAAFYNDTDEYAAQWLRNLIKKGLIPDGEVSTRSIIDLRPADLAGFTQCHFFAGIGGWAYAARLAGWPDDRPLWTGSAPCQPFSVAGKGAAQADERHLWPVFFDLIAAVRPPVVMGEQVAAAVGKDWLDGVCSDLESIEYACRAVVVPACAVDAPHRRDRLWFVADADELGACEGWQQRSGQFGRTGGDQSPRDSREPLADAGSGRRGGSGERQGQFARGAEAVGPGGGDVGNADMPHSEGGGVPGGVYTQDADVDGGGIHSFWEGAEWIIGADGKARRVEPSIRLLAHGVPARVGRLRAYGNAIVPQVAAEVIAAYMESVS